MHVIHIVQTLDPAAGGPPAVALRLAAAQRGIGCQTTVVAYSGDCGGAADAAAMAGIPDIEAVTVIRLGRESRSDRLLAKRSYTVLRRLLQAGNVLHLHGVWDPVLRAAAAAARDAGVPYALTPHGMLDPWSLAQRRWKKRAALLLGYRKMLDGAAFLHFLNEQESALTAPLGLRAPGEIVPNGIFAEEIAAMSVGGQRGAWLRHRPYILFLGRLHYKKGLDILAAAFQYVALRRDDVQLVVAGPDAGAGRDFERRIRAAGVASRVHVVGALYGSDKYAAYRHASLFCLPSRQEGFSMAITEAMGCGLPVVVTRECHFAEVEEAGAGAVTSLDPVEIGGALLRLLQDPSKLQTMGASAQALVMRHYTWPAIARRMAAAYDRHSPRLNPRDNIKSNQCITL